MGGLHRSAPRESEPANDPLPLLDQLGIAIVHAVVKLRPVVVPQRVEVDPMGTKECDESFVRRKRSGRRFRIAPAGERAHERDSHERPAMFSHDLERNPVGILIFHASSRETGATRHPGTAFWGARYAIVEDPDGNSLGIKRAGPALDEPAVGRPLSRAYTAGCGAYRRMIPPVLRARDSRSLIGCGLL